MSKKTLNHYTITHTLTLAHSRAVDKGSRRRQQSHSKVLLREWKRHTDLGVSSTPSVSQSGVPTLAGVPPPRPGLMGGGTRGRVLLVRSDWGGYSRWGSPQPGLTGVPEVGYPQPGPMGGYSRWGSPSHLPSLTRGVPEVGYPQQGEIQTRKSSYVNARGIPIMSYQVLHLFLEVGYPPWQGYPSARSDQGVPEVGYPQPSPTRGIPKVGTPPSGGTPLPGLMGGYPRWGYPPARGTPWPGLMGGTQGGVPPPPARSDWGIPKVGYSLAGGIPRQGVPPPGPMGVPKVGLPPRLDLAGVPLSPPSGWTWTWPGYPH